MHHIKILEQILNFQKFSYTNVHVLIIWKKRSHRSFESKEMFDQAPKFVFLLNLLSLVKMYIDEGSPSTIDFINLFRFCEWGFIYLFIYLGGGGGGGGGGFGSCCPFIFALSFWILCIRSMHPCVWMHSL